MPDRDKTLARIEKKLAKLASWQERVEARLDELASQLGDTAPAPGLEAATAGREEIVRFLDQFRAGEALGEASLGAWIQASDLGCVKGGLRTVQQREGFHARLLEQRIKELGGECRAEIPQAIEEGTMQGAADPDKGDAAKVLEFVQRFPDIDRALAPLFEMADRLDDDPETQALLRTIAQDERSTLEWFHEACRQLNGDA